MFKLTDESQSRGRCTCKERSCQFTWSINVPAADELCLNAGFLEVEPLLFPITRRHHPSEVLSCLDQDMMDRLHFYDDLWRNEWMDPNAGPDLMWVSFIYKVRIQTETDVQKLKETGKTKKQGTRTNKPEVRDLQQKQHRKSQNSEILTENRGNPRAGMTHWTEEPKN